jgi:hypothetical protein
MAFATIDVTKGITGTIPVANGGTGLASGTTGEFLKFTGSTTIASAAQAAGGKIGQIVSSSAQNYGNTTSTSFVDTGPTLNITPTATSSKVLLLFNSGTCYENNNYSNFYMYATFDRGGTNVAGSGAEITGTYIYQMSSVNDYGFTFHMNYLDSPSTTSQVTYKVMWRVNNSGAHIYHNLEGLSTITAMEVLA